MALRRQWVFASPFLRRCSYRQQRQGKQQAVRCFSWESDNRGAHGEGKRSGNGEDGGWWKEQHRKRGGQAGNDCDGGANAYGVLGLLESCSNEEIRAAFRNLAKATHPDLQTDTSTARFIRILAAYEILSDPSKRAEYDKLLKSRHDVQRSKFRGSASDETSGFDSTNVDDFWGFHSREDLDQKYPAQGSAEVVSWLRGYRAMVKEVIHQRAIGEAKGWEDELRGEVQSALTRAYFGPPVKEGEGLPECFEAEERAKRDLDEVLHLVSGRHLFGVVRQVQNPSLENGRENGHTAFLQSGTMEKFSDGGPDLSSMPENPRAVKEAGDVNRRYHTSAIDDVPSTSDGPAFVDLELQLFGNVVARAIRMPSTEVSEPASSSVGEADGLDDIYIYLSSEQVEEPLSFGDGRVTDESRFSRTLLGSIRGLGSASGVQNVCFAHGPDGTKTHVILQHSTPMVKHMQWFRVGGDGAACECRCRRASILPSRYWLFEPRTETHNVGGWYIETFDPTRRPQLDPARSTPREKNSSRMAEQLSDLLHPAMYIIAAAYKTLDEEEKASQRRESSLSGRIKKMVDLSRLTSGLSGWWKR